MGAFENDASRQRAWSILTQDNRGRLRNATRAELASAATGKGAVIVGFSPSAPARYPTAEYYDAEEFVARAKSELDRGRGLLGIFVK